MIHPNRRIHPAAAVAPAGDQTAASSLLPAGPALARPSGPPPTDLLASLSCREAQASDVAWRDEPTRVTAAIDEQPVFARR